MASQRAKYGDDWVPPDKTAEEFGYDEKDNRFGDQNLGQQFVWHKKVDEMVKRGEDPREMTDPRQQKKRKAELKEEIAKLKKRREEREEEKLQMEEERDRAAREREMLEHVGWEKKEDAFHLQMAKERTKMRIKENRARPIDQLAKNFLLDDNFDMQMREPWKVFKGLSIRAFEELRDSIEHFTQLGDHVDYWNALKVVCDDELEKARARDEAARHGDHGINHAVSDDINAMFEGKTSAELEDLNDQINGHIEQGRADDVEYWENLLKRLMIHKSKAKLKEVQQQLVQARLRKMTDTGDSCFDEEGGAKMPGQEEEMDAKLMPPPTELLSSLEKQREAEIDTVDEAEGWEPVLLSDVPEGEEDLVVTAEEDLAELRTLRNAVSALERKTLDQSLAEAHASASEEESLCQREKARALADQEAGEVAFGEEADTGDAEQYAWHNKYQPRKPKYFNRVHTGYEWNKYNQTHYDHDNPPPKVVQGYKFNIFYPDLIDKGKAPVYHINPDPDGNPELCVIRFSAGPPYEDIAFKVVNREWEYSHKKGYKCTFDRGILHLFFNFKRHRYRR